jgi:hypothetical protein
LGSKEELIEHPLSYLQRANPPSTTLSDEEEQGFFGRECDERLREMLAAGPVLHAEIMNVGRKAGFTPYALRRARERIAVTGYRDGFGPGSRFYWQLKSASICAP